MQDITNILLLSPNQSLVYAYGGGVLAGWFYLRFSCEQACEGMLLTGGVYNQRLSIIASLQLAPICHIKAEKCLM